MNIANVIIAELMGEFISGLVVRPVPGRPTAGDSSPQSPQQNARPSSLQPAPSLPEGTQPPPPPTAPVLQALANPVQEALDLAVQSALQRALTPGTAKQSTAQPAPAPSSQTATVPVPPAQSPVTIPEALSPKKSNLPKPEPFAPSVSSPAPEGKPEAILVRNEKAHFAYASRETTPSDNRSNTQEPVLASNVGLAAMSEHTVQSGQVTEWDSGNQSGSRLPAFHIAVTLPAVGRVEVGMAIVSGKSLRIRIRSSDEAFINNLRGELSSIETVASDMGFRLDAVLEHVVEQNDGAADLLYERNADVIG